MAYSSRLNGPPRFFFVQLFGGMFLPRSVTGFLFREFIRMISRFGTRKKKKKNLFFLRWRGWRWIFFWWLESSYGLSRRFCYCARLHVGGAISCKKRHMISTVFGWDIFCRVTTQKKVVLFRCFSHVVGWVWLLSTCDSDWGIWLPRFELAWRGPSDVAFPKKTLSFFFDSPIACNHCQGCLCLHLFLTISSLALQCNPYVCKSASSVCCFCDSCVRTVVCAVSWVWVSSCVCVAWSGVLLADWSCLEACFSPDHDWLFIYVFS